MILQARTHGPLVLFPWVEFVSQLHLFVCHQGECRLLLPCFGSVIIHSFFSAHKTNHSSIYSTDLEQSSLWLEVKIWKNASDFHGEKNSNSMVLLLDGLKGCQIIRHASLQVPRPTKQTIPQSIVLIWNKVASGWK